jgi:hypothetical protein
MKSLEDVTRWKRNIQERIEGDTGRKGTQERQNKDRGGEKKRKLYFLRG